MGGQPYAEDHPVTANRPRKQVSIHPSTYELARVLQDELSKKLGARVSMDMVFQRAFKCLQDAHGRGAWLSPGEAAPLLEQRHEGVIASVLAQFIGRSMPDRQLRRIAFDRQNKSVRVWLSDGPPVPLYVDSLQMSPEPSMGDR